jgi:putative membrane-bound dehydrogenase-like protein
MTSMIRAGWLCVALMVIGSLPAAAAERLSLLFLGDKGHHQPAARFKELAPVLAARGIDLVYTEALSDLNPDTLGKHAGLVLYANIDEIGSDQERALLEYVASGKGFIPLHCASFCFRNSKACVALMGAQFQKHGTGVFRVTPAVKDHPITKGYEGFESWDETYVHHLHNEKDRTILEFRIEGDSKEPWTWVRTHGKGRVFYTAWGHDARTWTNPGFTNLVERGIRWATGNDPSVVPTFRDRPEMTPIPKDVKPFTFGAAKLPNYLSGQKWGAQGDVITRMQLPLPAEESVKHYTTPVGFRVETFATEPKIGKPLAMTWDERGRLWLAETVDYPNQLQKEGEGRDRIRVCVDKDGDGQLDSSTVFAEKLSIPTSLAPAFGGMIVHQAPHTLFLKDTNGDDVADVRKVLFTGWATNDTHAGPSNLVYGPDGWYYGMVGYAGFEGTIAGEKQSFRTGFYRFRLTKGADGTPDVTRFEFLRNTNNNSWGVGFSEDGTLFGSTANGNPSVYLPIPNRYYERVKGWSSSVLGGIAESNKFEPVTDNVRQVDWHGGFTAAAGHALYTARTWPKEYWNRAAFVTEPTGHLVATFILSPTGADYRSKNSWNILASDDEWAAPIMAEVGPDGQLWVIDWYNIIVQHNPTPVGFSTGKGNAYETDLRDTKHGRVYRIVAEGGRPSAWPKLAGADEKTLVAALGSDNLFWRRHAQRLLIERGDASVVSALRQLVENSIPDEIGLNVAATHALGVLSAYADGEAGTKVLSIAGTGLKNPSAAVRRAALRAIVAGPFVACKSVEMRLVNEAVLAEKDPQTRLAGLLALADCKPCPDAGTALATLTEDDAVQSDRWLGDAFVAAAATHAGGFLTHVKSADGPAAGRIAIVAEHVGRSADAETVKGLIAVLKDRPADVIAPIVGGLAKGWPKDTPLALAEDEAKALVALFEKAPSASKSQLISLAGRWKVDALEVYAGTIVAGLRTTLADGKGTDADRIAVARQLVEFQPASDDAAVAIVKQITSKASPDLVKGLLDALAGSTSPAGGKSLAESAVTLTPVAKSMALRVLLTRADWSGSLLEAVEKGTLPLGDLALDQKQALAAHPDKKLADRAKALLAKGGGLPSADRQKVIDELHAVALGTGRADNGKQVFLKQCSKCHVHGSEGQRVGPDLTGMAVHPKEELLVHILDPNRSVEGNFRLYTAELTDGRILSGMLASETKTTVELVDTEGKRMALQRDDIEELVATTKSLMPEGFEKQASPSDLADLLEFLTKKGRFVPLPLDKAATVVTTKGMFYASESEVERLIFSDWSPKTFEGVPFQLVDPRGGTVPNGVLLYGPNGKIPPTMPKSVTIPCATMATKLHLLSGVGGWSYPASEKGTVSMTVRIKYADGKIEDHDLVNGEHFADYIRRVDVPGSKFAFAVRGQQLRYLSVEPKRRDPIKELELVKGPDNTAPVVMAVTVETGAE